MPAEKHHVLRLAKQTALGTQLATVEGSPFASDADALDGIRTDMKRRKKKAPTRYWVIKGSLEEKTATLTEGVDIT